MGIDRGTKHLLDAGDTLDGNLVDPIGLSGAWNGSEIITQPAANPDRLLNLSADSSTGQMVTVAISAFVANFTQAGVPNSLPAGESYQFPALAGPLTCRIEFGNGAQVIAAEIDIAVSGRSALPLMTAPPTDIPIAQFMNTIEGTTQFTVPGGVLRVYGRNDSNLVTPACSLFNNDIFGVPSANPAFPGFQNIPRGMGPWWQGNPVPVLNPNEVIPVPAAMRAVATYFTRPSGQRSRNSKTVWVYNALPGNSAAVLTNNNRPAIYFVPPLAKSVRVLRNNTTVGGAVDGPSAGVDLYLYDAMITPYEPLERLSVAATVPSPTFDLPMSCVAIGVVTNTAEVTQLCLDFEIGI
jgi:hypothetical protein